MNSNPSYTEQDIKKIVASTVDFHIWQNKKKKPVVRTIIFDN
jgi:hypothetical protein